MRYKQAFIVTRKSGDSKAQDHSKSAELIRRAGIVHQVASGHFDYLPLGMKILKKIEAVVRKEMTAAAALEILMPIMQPAELWRESGRWDVYGDEMFKIKNRAGREFCLGPTHEELVVDLAKHQIESYRDLPVTLFQVATKFRDELRPRGGLIRAKEFLMKDAYSFDIDEGGLDRSYLAMREAYFRIMKRLNVSVVTVSADSGEIGGGFSEEFLAASEDGEDAYVLNSNGQAEKVESEGDGAAIRAIEVGHIFKLGTRYSSAMGLSCPNQSGVSTPLLMGCYGIGISRLLPTAALHNCDDRGIIWPKEISPFDISIIVVPGKDETAERVAEDLWQLSLSRGIDVLFDDRTVSLGVKLNDFEALGIPRKLTVGARDLAKGTLELEIRATGEKRLLNVTDIRNDPSILLRD